MRSINARRSVLFMLFLFVWNVEVRLTVKFIEFWHVVELPVWDGGSGNGSFFRDG